MLEKMEESVDSEAIIEEFELLSKDAWRVQEETLNKILKENENAEYLKLRCGLNGRTDTDSFMACVPLATHKDFEPYISRILDGAKSPILTGKPISTISLSSGTTEGKPKYVPFNGNLIENTMQVYKTSFAYRNKEYPIANGMALQFIYGSKQFRTKGGLQAGTATTNVYRSVEFKKTMTAIQTPCCSPDEVIFGDNFHQSLYCHHLCGLIFKAKVQVISSTFAHSIVHAFRNFEQIWEELVNDICKGSLNRKITSKPIQSAMAKLLKPDPELASEIHNKCLGLSNWYGLIPALFPNAKYVYGIMTGSMEPYLEKLRHYAGGLPLLSADYGSSEGWIGINVNPRLPPELTSFAVLPNVGYFEFVPVNEDKLKLPVGLTEVEVGKEYEIILTNFAGLYRYKLGDVVKVKGFHNSTPELQFICRKNLLLNINIDKNTEKDLQVVVESTSAKYLSGKKLEVVDFTSFVDFSTDPAHYVVFWEINGEANDELLGECCNCLDTSFVDAGYKSSRKVNSIGPLELRVLKTGTFHRIMDYNVELGAAASQFKTPRCVPPTNTKVLQILLSNVVKCYFSTAY